MPTFTALALDTLLEPGTSKSVDKSIPKPVPNPKSGPNSKLERRNSTSVAEKKPRRPLITPSLYATPETTPLPDSPTSFTPSPYIINHKRRGPRLLKSSSESNVTLKKKAQDEEEAKINAAEAESLETKVVDSAENAFTFKIVEPVGEARVNGSRDCESSNGKSGNCRVEIESGDETLGNDMAEVGSSGLSDAWARIQDSLKQVPMTPGRDSDREDFYDPQESLSFVSITDVEENTEGERRAVLATPAGEFFDAWEELSSECGSLQSSRWDVESELRNMRLSLLMEIEKRKQAEEALSNVQKQWQNIRQQLSLVGLTLPTDPTVGEESGDELCCQVQLARFVANCVGRGSARAELEAEMETQIEGKNFEIARLCDKLRNYEAMNQEMVQRNRDVLETARRERERKERRQRWMWGSLAAALTLGAAGLAWSYLPSGGAGSSSSSSSSSLLSSSFNDSEAPQSENGAN